VAVAGPLHPVDVAVTVVVPLQPAAYVTSPVDELIVLPPAMLGPSRLYVTLVELDDVAE
jgi:hypothetical protein